MSRGRGPCCIAGGGPGWNAAGSARPRFCSMWSAEATVPADHWVHRRWGSASSLRCSAWRVRLPEKGAHCGRVVAKQEVGPGERRSRLRSWRNQGAPPHYGDRTSQAEFSLRRFRRQRAATFIDPSRTGIEDRSPRCGVETSSDGPLLRSRPKPSAAIRGGRCPTGSQRLLVEGRRTKPAPERSSDRLP